MSQSYTAFVGWGIRLRKDMIKVIQSDVFEDGPEHEETGIMLHEWGAGGEDKCALLVTGTMVQVEDYGSKDTALVKDAGRLPPKAWEDSIEKICKLLDIKPSKPSWIMGMVVD